MSATMIRDYGSRLRRELAGRNCAIERVVAETENHLSESVDRLLASGMPEAEAVRTAVARFGPPRLVAAGFAPEITMIRLMIGAAAALTMLGALVSLFFTVTQLGDSPLWDASRLVAAVGVLAVGALTWTHIRRAAAKTTPWLLAGAVGLVALGAAGTTSSLYLGQITGDTEYPIILLNTLIFGQGALTVWHLWSEQIEARA